MTPVRPFGLESSTLPLSHCPPYQKIVEVKKKAQEEQHQPKQPLSSTSKVSLDDIDQGVVRRTIASMYSLKKVLPTLDNIRTELKQSIDYTGNTGSKGCLLHMKFAYTRCGVNQKVLMKRQDVALSRIRYLRIVRELRGGLHSRLYRCNLRSYQSRCPEMLAR